MSERPMRLPLLAEIERTVWLTPHMVRVVLGGDGLDGFPAGRFTDHYLKLQLPPPGAPYRAPFDVEAIKAELPRELWPRTRTYSVRAWDRAARRLTIDVVYHGDSGVGGPWAAAAQAGDTLQLVGPGGAYRPDPAADWHLMVGDTSAMPAIAASLERVPPGARVHALVEIGSPDEEIDLASTGDLSLRWVAGGDGEPLLAALRELTFPEGAVHAFVHGEAGMVRELRRHLLVDRGVPRGALSVSGYWKRRRSEEGWREDKAEWNQLVEADA